MNKKEKIALMKGIASNLEALLALIPLEDCNASVDIDKEKIKIGVYGHGSRKFVRSLGGKAGPWYANDSQRSIKVSLSERVSVSTAETSVDIERDRRGKKSKIS